MQLIRHDDGRGVHEEAGISFRGRRYPIRNGVVDGIPDDVKGAELDALLAHGFHKVDSRMMVEVAAQKALKDAANDKKGESPKA